jgi:hypothetical protein
MRDTPFAEELSRAELGGHRIERLRIKDGGHEDIRFSWWRDGKFVPQAFSMPEERLLELLGRAIENNLFSQSFLDGLSALLAKRKQLREAAQEP